MEKERDFREEVVRTDSEAKKPYEKPELTAFDLLRTVTGGST
jgi:predicted Ser/Thr protein kinase